VRYQAEELEDSVKAVVRVAVIDDAATWIPCEITCGGILGEVVPNLPSVGYYGRYYDGGVVLDVVSA
jgi:hypothetical protein